VTRRSGEVARVFSARSVRRSPRTSPRGVVRSVERVSFVRGVSRVSPVRGSPVRGTSRDSPVLGSPVRGSPERGVSRGSGRGSPERGVSREGAGVPEEGGVEGGRESVGFGFVSVEPEPEVPDGRGFRSAVPGRPAVGESAVQEGLRVCPSTRGSEERGRSEARVEPSERARSVLGATLVSEERGRSEVRGVGRSGARESPSIRERSELRRSPRGRSGTRGAAVDAERGAGTDARGSERGAGVLARGSERGAGVLARGSERGAGVLARGADSRGGVDARGLDSRGAEVLLDGAGRDVLLDGAGRELEELEELDAEELDPPGRAPEPRESVLPLGRACSACSGAEKAGVELPRARIIINEPRRGIHPPPPAQTNHG